MFSKIDVNGDNTHPVYQFLKECFPGDIAWNFKAKFLVDRTGTPVRRFGKESWEEIEEALAATLKQNAADDNKE
jgi:glutathione peroxidase